MNTKERVDCLQASAMETIEAIGVSTLDAMPRDVFAAYMRPVCKQFADDLDCHPQTAKRHLYRAIRRQRNPNWTPPQRGGARDGAGRPAHPDAAEAFAAMGEEPLGIYEE